MWRVDRLDQINARKTAKLPDSRSLTLSFSRRQIWPGFFPTPPIQDHILKMMLAAPETTAYQAMAATFAAGNWTEETFTVPALGIYADHSTADDPVYFKKIFPNGSTVEVPGTGHFVMLEKPAEFNKLLADFLPQAAF